MCVGTLPMQLLQSSTDVDATNIYNTFWLDFTHFKCNVSLNWMYPGSVTALGEQLLVRHSEPWGAKPVKQTKPCRIIHHQVAATYQSSVQLFSHILQLFSCQDKNGKHTTCQLSLNDVCLSHLHCIIFNCEASFRGNSEGSYLISTTSALLSSYFLFHSFTSISLVMIWLEDRAWREKCSDRKD